jgi:hypothetical protein
VDALYPVNPGLEQERVLEKDIRDLAWLETVMDCKEHL